MSKPEPTPEQQARASRLRATIGKMVPGPPAKPQTPRAFTDAAAAAERKKARKAKGPGA